MLDPFDDDDEVERLDAPICSTCGVTMLPADAFGSGFACANDDCEAMGSAEQGEAPW